MAKAEFLKMEKAGIIRRSTSAWASPLQMVPKPDGSWRPCGDYLRLNTVTTPDRYPVLHIQDFTQRLSGKSIFTKLDLVKGYYLPGEHAPLRHSQDGDHDPLLALGVRRHAVWTAQCREHF